MFAFEAVRELLLNVVKHATVKKAELQLRLIKGGHVRIQVRDKGVGFSLNQHKEAKSHLGLFRIQERAESFGCRFEVTSQPNKGTCVTLILPRSEKDVTGGGRP
jgi:signal transduction histidine kinase